MGQYYYGVLLNKDNGEIRAANYNGKLTESGMGDFLLFSHALSGNGGYAHSRVIWAGDYSERAEENFPNLYNKIRSLENRVVQLNYNAEAFDVTGYICNHDRRECIDIEKTKAKYQDLNELNPLALLCSDPDCRCLGGGDYYKREGFWFVSLWYNHELSTEQNIPFGYNEIEPDFLNEGGTSVWTFTNLPEALTGNDSCWQVVNSFVRMLERTQGNVSWRMKHLDALKVEFKTFLSLINEKKIQKSYKRFIKELENAHHRESSVIRISYWNHDTGRAYPFVVYEDLTFRINVVGNEIFWDSGVSCVFDNEHMYSEKNGKIHYKYRNELKKILKALN